MKRKENRIPWAQTPNGVSLPGHQHWRAARRMSYLPKELRLEMERRLQLSFPEFVESKGGLCPKK